jgi:hypothetical protein
MTTFLPANSGRYFLDLDSARARSLPRLIEIAQIRRGLALLGRHQEAVAAEHVALFANEYLDDCSPNNRRTARSDCARVDRAERPPKDALARCRSW